MPPFQLALFFPTTYTNSQTLWFMTFLTPGSITFTQGSWIAASSRTTFTSNTKVFTIFKNGSSIATLTFNAGGNTPTISSLTGSPVSFIPNDNLSITAPPVADATGSGLSITFLGTRA